MSPDQIKAENSKRRALKKSGSRASPKKIRLIKDPNAPKRPRSAFNFFVQDSVTLGSGARNEMREIGRRWKALSDTDRRVSNPFITGAY
jgi:hypothetical protein